MRLPGRGGAGGEGEGRREEGDLVKLGERSDEDDGVDALKGVDPLSALVALAAHVVPGTHQDVSDRARGVRASGWRPGAGGERTWQSRCRARLTNARAKLLLLVAPQLPT